MRNPVPIAIAVVCVLCVAGCSGRTGSPTVAVPSDIASLAGAYPKDLAQATRAGFPVSVAQFIKPDPPADQNAATVYQQLVAQLNGHPLAGTDTAIDQLGGQVMPPEGALEAAKMAIDDRADLLRLAHEAAARRQCYFKKAWDGPNPALVAFPEMTGMLEAARMISAESLVLASEGKPLQAVQNEALCFRIADHAATEPTVMGYLLANGIATTSAYTLQRILYISHGDPQASRAVQTAIAEEWREPSLSAAFANQGAFQQSTVRYLHQAGFGELAHVPGEVAGSENRVPASWRAAGSHEWSAFLDANGDVMLKDTTQLAGSADKPYGQAKDAIQSVVQDLARSNSLSHLLADYEIEVTPQMPDDRAKLAAILRATEAGAAVLAWKGSHGAYPKSLAQAMPAVPADPFTGEPLRYKLDGDGFVIYSVGPWRLFDGGSQVQAPGTTDVSFRYPLPLYLMPPR